MDQENGNKPEANGRHEAAPHISMELQADSARVTNLTMEGTRLILTIEAELSSSQVKATGAPAGPRPARTRDTEELTDSALLPPGQRRRATESETWPGVFPQSVHLAEQGGQPSSTIIVEEKRLEKVFSLGEDAVAGDFGPAGGSGGAGLAASPVPDPAAGESSGPGDGADPVAEVGEISYEQMENKIRDAKNRGTTIRAERPFGERFAPGADADAVSGVDDTVSLDSKSGNEPAPVAENPLAASDIDSDTHDIALAGIPGAADEQRPGETEGWTPISESTEMRSDHNTATQPISYDSLPGADADGLPVLGDGANGEPSPAETRRDAPAVALSEMPDDVLESLPPFAAATAPAEAEMPERVIRIQPADLDDSLAVSDESSAVGGERHGEPQPAMVFGCDAPAAEPPSAFAEQPPAPDAEAFADEPAPSGPVIEPEIEPAPEPISAPDGVASSGPERETVSETVPFPEPMAAPTVEPGPVSPPEPAVVADAPDREPAPAPASRDAPMAPPPEPAPLPAPLREPAAGPESADTPDAAPSPAVDGETPPPPEEPACPKPGDPAAAGGGTTVLIRYTCPKCKTQGMQAVDKVGTVVNCSNCGKAMRLVMKR